MPTLERTENVFVLDLGDGENRFHPDWVDVVSAALDEVEKAEGPRALVTAATGKFYSNGLDLDWLSANGDQWEPYLGRVHGVFARLLSLPLPTVAAINGHAFAGGAMLALSHDFAVMRDDRGYFCLPEVDLGMNFTTGMSALIRSRLPGATAHEAMITGRRYTAVEAQAAGIVQRIAPEAGVLPAAVALAAGLAGKNGSAVGKIRTGLYEAAIEVLNGPVVLR